MTTLTREQAEEVLQLADEMVDDAWDGGRSEHVSKSEVALYVERNDETRAKLVALLGLGEEAL